MKVKDLLERIKDVKYVKEKVKKFDANRDMAKFILTEKDCGQIWLFLEDYERSLLNREVIENFDEV